MKVRPLAVVGALAAGLGWPALAEAAPGTINGDVNMRSGPGTQYQRVTILPAGAPVEVFACQGAAWCDVAYGSYRGWVAGNYINRGYAPAPVAGNSVNRGYAPKPDASGDIPEMPMPPPVYEGDIPEAPDAPPAYAYRSPPPYSPYGRPTWDDRYNAWYDGRRWYYRDRWYDRPTFGLYFGIGG